MTALILSVFTYFTFGSFMKKLSRSRTVTKLFTAVSSLVGLSVLAISVQAAPMLIPSPPSIAAKGYILMDANSGKVIIEKNADEELEPASLTKMMTAYVADYEIAQGNISKSDITKISRNAWAQNKVFKGSSLMWLQAGKTVSVADLLKGVIISSGNDATVALAEHIAGSSSAFVDIMNQHAQLLGMKNTYFENPHGLPAPSHRTTARDMSTLAQAIIRDFPNEYKLYAEKSFTYNGIKQPNRNKLLWTDPTVDGLKTGHTESAGFCLVASAKKSDMRLISVVMGAHSDKARAQESQKLLSYGFRYYQTLKLYSKGEILAQSAVYSGEQDTVNVVAKDDVYVTVPRSQRDKVVAELDVVKYLQAPLLNSQVVGDIVVSLNGEVLSRQPITVEQEVKEGGLFTRLWDMIALFFIQLVNG